MNWIALCISKLFLGRVLGRPCGNIVPRSGAKGAAVNCFIVAIDKEGHPYLLVSQLVEDILHCLAWNGTSYVDSKEIELATISPKDIYVTHLYGNSEIRFSGIFKLAIGRTFFLPYLNIKLVNIISDFDQYIFNKKKLVTRQRIDLLKFLVDQNLNGQQKHGTISLMTQLYSMKWVFHPDRDSQHQKLKIYLESLVDSGDLKKISGHEFEVTARALKTIEEYEEQERKHIENVKIQRRLFWLTFVVALFTAAQAGIIKLPTILDLTKKIPVE